MFALAIVGVTVLVLVVAVVLLGAVLKRCCRGPDDVDVGPL